MMKTANLENLSLGQRIFRFGSGTILITSVLAASGPLGWLAVLPLIGIYPALTAFIGYCPVYAVMEEVGYESRQAVPA